MSQSKAREARRKGTFLEDIAQRMITGPGMTSKVRQFVPVIKAPPGRPLTKNDYREIDILVSRKTGDEEERWAVECKNYGSVINVGQMGEFVHKLSEIGIPTRNGIYVSTVRYASGAIRVAQTEGILLLRLDGLTDDRLDSAAFGAVQSVVHLLLRLDGYGVKNSLPSVWLEGDPMTNHMTAYFDKDKNLVGTVFDVIWRMWRAGRLSTTIGKHQKKLEIPEGWFQYVEQDGLLVPEKGIGADAKFSIIAYITSIKGSATRHVLSNAEDMTPRIATVDASFPALERLEDGVIVVKDLAAIKIGVASTEAQLTKFLEEQKVGGVENVVEVIQKTLLPRIYAFGAFGEFYYPLSEANVKKMEELEAKYGSQIPDSEVLGADAIRENFADVWDPIHPAHPVD